MANRFFVEAHESVTDVPTWIAKVEGFLSKVASSLKYDGEEVCVLLCKDDYIEELNSTYRNVDTPTDVLSFPDGGTYEESGVKWRSMGDIAVSLDTLSRNVKDFGVEEDEELKRLLVHGLLHLNGMDHGEEHLEKGKSPKCEMLVLQEKLLKDFSDYKIIGA